METRFSSRLEGKVRIWTNEKQKNLKTNSLKKSKGKEIRWRGGERENVTGN